MAPEPIRMAATANLLANFGNPSLDTNDNYTIFGMLVPVVTITGQVESAFDYVSELIGDDPMTESTMYRKIAGFVGDYASLLLLDVLDGLVITTHFNYTSGGLNIQKPAVGQMASLHDNYTKRCNRWRKILLTRSITSKLTDLDLALINEQEPEGSGIMEITYDAKNL